MVYLGILALRGPAEVGQKIPEAYMAVWTFDLRFMSGGTGHLILEESELD